MVIFKKGNLIMNCVLLIGRTTRDIELRYTQNQTAVARFTLAVDRHDKDKNSDFISCIAFGKTAEAMNRYVSKGNKIAVSGRIQTGSYTNKDGQKVYTTDVIADRVEFIESKPKAESKNEEKDNNGFMQLPEGVDAELPFN